LSSFYLLDRDSVPPIFPDPPQFADRVGLEIGRIADHVIAPLISAYVVSGARKYLRHARRIGEELLTVYNSSLFRPFIGVLNGQFDEREVLLDSISSLYPVFAALAFHTNDKRFIPPIRTFLDALNRSIENQQIANRYSLNGSNKGTHRITMDVPWRIYADIARIRRILPSIRTDHLLNLVAGFLSPSNPVKYYDVDGMILYSIHPCSVGSYLPEEHSSFAAVVKKCGKLVKRSPLPSRLTGAS
jgi:hypothetical protein